MQYLVDRGIDLTIRDYRWDSTAAGWARHALRDETMAQWLEKAEREREQCGMRMSPLPSRRLGRSRWRGLASPSGNGPSP